MEDKWILDLFSKIWKIESMYRAERMGERSDSWPIPILALKIEKQIGFTYIEFVC